MRRAPAFQVRIRPSRSSRKIAYSATASTRSRSWSWARSPASCSKWREQDSNLRRQCQRIYSPSPLTARESRRERTPVSLGGVAQPLRFGQRLELLERVVLDLADALARDVERPPD